MQHRRGCADQAVGVQSAVYKGEILFLYLVIGFCLHAVNHGNKFK